MKCTILDFSKGETHIIDIDKEQIDDIEDILLEYDYRLKDIEYMITEDIKMRID